MGAEHRPALEISDPVAAWLTELGLPQYVPLFEENGIDMDVLPELDADLLKEMGVTVLGHRLKLTKAIAALKEAPTPTDPPVQEHQAAAKDPAAAERRNLTIMFCDLVGSTALSAKLDPEDYRDVMTLYQKSVTDVVTRAGGHVAKYLGDGVLIYFGYPVAQEDAAERACRAGLEIINAIARLDTVAGDPLQVRLGVATGIVVVGDLQGDGINEASAVAGETPNLAARLEGVAQAGQIVISDKTHQLLGDMFHYEKLDDVALKGFETGQIAWRVLSETQAQERFSIGHGRKKLTPLVGRDAERARLMQAWDLAKSGKGQVFLLSGEAGIGKSRLSRELLYQAFVDQAEILHFQAAQYFSNTALYPIKRQLETAMDYAHDTDMESRLDKLDETIVEAQNLGEARALMASLLSLPGDRYPALTFSPALQKARTIQMLIELAVVRSTRAPLLIHFEDLHWVDPTTLELLNAFVAMVSDHPILLLATFRPEFSHEWEADFIQSVELSRLRKADIEALLDSMTEGQNLSGAQRQHLLQRSDGVPLFAEELTRFVLENHEDGSAEMQIPDTLQDSLMARLDKLGDARKLAQIGAAIGREFDIELLAQVAGRSKDAVTVSMSQLAEADLVFPARGNTSWVFHHALLQEAAYRSMLRKTRQKLHGEIAETLETKFPERCERGPEQVAGHLKAAGLGARSVPYWLTAGKSAWQRASMAEALKDLGEGLALVQKIEDKTERTKVELQLQSTIGVVHFAATSYASPQAQAAFERAVELFEDVEDVDLRVAVLYGIGAFQTMRGNVHEGHQTFADLEKDALRSGNPRYEIYSASMQAWSHFNRGDYQRCIDYAERVNELYRQGAWDQPGPRLSAADPKVISECFRATALWSLGYPDQAVTVGLDVLSYARSLPDPYSLVYALANGVIRVKDWNGDWDKVVELTSEGNAVAREFGYAFLGLWGNMWRARALAQQGELEEAEAMTAKGVAACKGAGVHYHGVGFEANHARQLMALGQLDQAAKILANQDAALSGGGEFHHATDLLLAKAELAKLQGQSDLSHTNYREAFEIAEKRGALGWQLRAALGLADLEPDAGGQHALIAPLYGRFSEGFDTKDLRAAAEYL